MFCGGLAPSCYNFVQFRDSLPCAGQQNREAPGGRRSPAFRL